MQSGLRGVPMSPHNTNEHRIVYCTIVIVFRIDIVPLLFTATSSWTANLSTIHLCTVFLWTVSSYFLCSAFLFKELLLFGVYLQGYTPFPPPHIFLRAQDFYYGVLSCLTIWLLSRLTSRIFNILNPIVQHCYLNTTKRWILDLVITYLESPPPKKLKFTYFIWSR